MRGDTEKPSPSDLAALRDLISFYGEARTGKLLRIHREPVARMLAGLDVRSGTVYLLRARMAELQAVSSKRARHIALGRQGSM